MIENKRLKPAHYGLTSVDFKDVEKKLAKQKQFLENVYIRNKITNSIIPLKNGVVSPYHSPERYYGSIQQRVSALVEFAQNKALKPIFMTITLPSEYHPKKQKNGKLVDNPKYNGMEAKEANQELTKRFAKLRHDRSIKELSNDNRVYFRVTEPHEDGTPHLHVLMFVPSDSVDKIVMAFERIFRSRKNERKANDIQTIETDIKNSTAYIMKYINKVLPLSKKEKLSQKEKYLNAWYSKHKITRFYSSRTLAPLEVYKLIHNHYSLLELTYVKKSGSLAIYRDVETQKIMEILEDGEYLYIRDTNIELLSTLTASHSTDYAKPDIYELYALADVPEELELCG